MDVRKIIRERRLREAAEELRRKSTNALPESVNHQSESSVQRISPQLSARSSRPSSQFGDAESPPEWYESAEGNTIRFLLESGVRIVHVFIRSHCGSSFSFAWRNGANEIGVRYENKRDAF